MSQRWFLLVSAAVYTAAWWLAVLLQGEGLIWLCLLLLVHFALSPTRLKDFRLLPLALIGMTMDTLLMYAGVYEFSAMPVWLMLLWLHFLLAMGHCLAWLGKQPIWVQVFTGVFGGAGSYIAGAELGAVAMPLGNLLTFLLIAPLWGTIIPGFFWLQQRLPGNGDYLSWR